MLPPINHPSTRTDEGRSLAVTGLSNAARSTIPPSHRDLVDCPRVAALTTLMPDGAPQTSVVWCDWDAAGPDRGSRLSRLSDAYSAFAARMATTTQTPRSPRMQRIPPARLLLVLVAVVLLTPTSALTRSPSPDPGWVPPESGRLLLAHDARP